MQQKVIVPMHDGMRKVYHICNYNGIDEIVDEETFFESLEYNCSSATESGEYDSWADACDDVCDKLVKFGECEVNGIKYSIDTSGEEEYIMHSANVSEGINLNDFIEKVQKNIEFINELEDEYKENI